MKHSLITPPLFKEYLRLDTPFKTYEEFFDQFAQGKRVDNGIDTRTVGHNNDADIFWFTEDEYPFAYTFPRHIVNEGFIFYIRENQLT